MSGEEYINAPTLIHKTAKRYHFLLRFIDSAPSIFPFIGRSAIRHSASRAFPVSFYYQRYIRFSAIAAPRWLTHDEISRRDAWLACLAVVLSRDCVLKLLDVLDAAMSIANLLTRSSDWQRFWFPARVPFSPVTVLVFRVRGSLFVFVIDEQWFFCGIGNNGLSFSIYF